MVATGDVYEGQWKEGKRHGKGWYVSADGGNDGDRPATAGLGPPGWCQCYPCDRWLIPKSLFLSMSRFSPEGCVWSYPRVDSRIVQKKGFGDTPAAPGDRWTGARRGGAIATPPTAGASPNPFSRYP